MTSHTTTVTSCPVCKKTLIWSTENPYRPFCSERCKAIDLGNWANEDYRIPVEEPSELKDTPYDDE